MPYRALRRDPAQLLMKKLALVLVLLAATISIGAAGCGGSGGSSGNGGTSVPADIRTIMNQPIYKGATWGLRVLDGGKVLVNLRSKDSFLIGSVRKNFTVGELLNQVGAAHTYDTPVFRQGSISGGVLNGDLILVASGDLTMGGRTNPDGSIAISNFDHNEANSLGNAVLTQPNPLAGYVNLAHQVAAAGITEITGNIAIDDRLFQPYNFRDEFEVRPIFVNDDCVDMTMNPTTPGSLASLVWRPLSAAFAVNNEVMTSAAGTEFGLKFKPNPDCIGSPGCTGNITGTLPIDFKPFFTGVFPLVQTFRITKPANYARTVFIEALQSSGVKVDAAPVAQNPVEILPPKNSYLPANQVAMLTGLPYSDDAKLVQKISYNIGADASLILFGLTPGVDNMTDALQVEQTNLADNYGITPDEYHFVDGSGNGETSATMIAVTRLLEDMIASPEFPVYFAALPILAVDGSLAFVTDFQSDPSLSGATGQVFAKTGTFVTLVDGQPILKAQAYAGYLNTSRGRHLIYEVVVNNVPVTDLNQVAQVFQDEGTISAMLWRDF